MTRGPKTTASAATPAGEAFDRMKDGDAAGPLPPSDAAPLARRRNEAGQFLDGPGRDASMAALARADGVKKRRHIVTQTLLDAATPEDVLAHFKRMNDLIRHGSGKDAVAAFKALYSLMAVPASSSVDREGKAGGDLPLHAPVVVMIEPEPR